MYPIIVVLLIIYVVCNLITAKCWSAKEMKRDFVDGQCLVGKVFANIFYAPAWLLKGIRIVVLASVR